MKSILLVFLALLTGCYAYSPIPAGPLSRGTTVRAELAEPSDFRLTELTANSVVSVAGEVVSHDTNQLVVSALWLRSRTGHEFAAAGETLTIPAERLAAVQRKRFSVIRSAAIAGAGVLVGALFLAAFETGGASAGGGGGTPLPQ